MENKSKGLIDKVREMVFAEEKLSDVVEVSFAEVTLKDGKSIEINGEIAVGSETKAEDGDYILEDGRTLKVVEGKISEIVEAKEDEAKPEEKEVVEAELAEEDKPEAKKEDKPEEKKEDKEEDKVDPLEARVAELEKMVESLMSQFSEVNGKVEKFSALPADKEIKIKKVELSSVATKRKSGIEALAEYRNK